MSETEHPCIRRVNNNCDQKLTIPDSNSECPFLAKTAHQCPEFQDRSNPEYTHITEILKTTQDASDEQMKLYQQQLEKMRKNK